jgi:hypothetical protein
MVLLPSPVERELEMGRAAKSKYLVIREMQLYNFHLLRYFAQW